MTRGRGEVARGGHVASPLLFFFGRFGGVLPLFFLLDSAPTRPLFSPLPVPRQRADSGLPLSPPWQGQSTLHCRCVAGQGRRVSDRRGRGQPAAPAAGNRRGLRGGGGCQARPDRAAAAAARAVVVAAVVVLAPLSVRAPRARIPLRGTAAHGGQEGWMGSAGAAIGSPPFIGTTPLARLPNMPTSSQCVFQCRLLYTIANHKKCSHCVRTREHCEQIIGQERGRPPSN